MIDIKYLDFLYKFKANVENELDTLVKKYANYTWCEETYKQDQELVDQKRDSLEREFLRLNKFIEQYILIHNK